MSDAVPDATDPVAKIGDLAASAGVRRIHVLAWRDLDDVEAGGSEVHIAEVAKLWAAAGLEVTMRTSWAQGQPTETVRDGYRVIRRAGRHMVFPRAAVAEILGRTGPRDVLVEIWNGMPFLSPVWNRGPRVVFLHHVHAEMWNMTLGDTLGPLGALFEAKVAPPLYRSSAIATLSESSKEELVHELGFRDDRVTVVHPGHRPPLLARRRAQPRPDGRRRRPPRPGQALRRARAGRAPRAPAGSPTCASSSSGDGYEKPRVQAVIDELDASDWVTLRGHITDSELVDLYRTTWIVASASAREGWGMTMTEAAACGTPAVATRIAGHADAVRDGRSGLLTDHDPTSLGDAMARVLGDDALRARLGAGALSWAGELTWSNTATQLMRVVAGEVARRRAHR